MLSLVYNLPLIRQRTRAHHNRRSMYPKTQKREIRMGGRADSYTTPTHPNAFTRTHSRTYTHKSREQKWGRLHLFMSTGNRWALVNCCIFSTFICVKAWCNISRSTLCMLKTSRTCIRSFQPAWMKMLLSRIFYGFADSHRLCFQLVILTAETALEDSFFAFLASLWVSMTSLRHSLALLHSRACCVWVCVFLGDLVFVVLGVGSAVKWCVVPLLLHLYLF